MNFVNFAGPSGPVLVPRWTDPGCTPGSCGTGNGRPMATVNFVNFAAVERKFYRLGGPQMAHLWRAGAIPGASRRRRSPEPKYPQDSTFEKVAENRQCDELMV